MACFLSFPIDECKVILIVHPLLSDCPMCINTIVFLLRVHHLNLVSTTVFLLRVHHLNFFFGWTIYLWHSSYTYITYIHHIIKIGITNQCDKNIYMYQNIYHIYIHIHTHTPTYIYIHTYIYIYIYTNTHTYIYTYIHAPLTDPSSDSIVLHPQSWWSQIVDRNVRYVMLSRSYRSGRSWSTVLQVSTNTYTGWPKKNNTETNQNDRH